MGDINFKKKISGPMDSAVAQVVESLGAVGFGVLTRIDLHLKVKEKLGKDLRPVVILGACNPQLAFEAYQHNSDVASLLPCNVVLRDLGENLVSVEIAKPTALMQVLGDAALTEMAGDADRRLRTALDTLATAQIIEWSPAELNRHIDSCELIDVRRAEEFDGPLSHIRNSKLVTLGPDLQKFLSEQDPKPSQNTVVFICRSGVRSLEAAMQARALGFERVVNLKGGMIAWNESKLSTAQDSKGV